MAPGKTHICMHLTGAEQWSGFLLWHEHQGMTFWQDTKTGLHFCRDMFESKSDSKQGGIPQQN